MGQRSGVGLVELAILEASTRGASLCLGPVCPSSPVVGLRGFTR
jgi:hypothetical protein